MDRETDAVTCPYCGEAVDLDVDPIGPPSEQYIEDCSVCCRPCVVRVERDGENVTVTLIGEDE
jgi:hypothetical protein